MFMKRLRMCLKIWQSYEWVFVGFRAPNVTEEHGPHQLANVGLEACPGHFKLALQILEESPMGKEKKS